MNTLEIIEKKRNNERLTGNEIKYFFNGYLNDIIPDYQMSAFLMAVVLNGMTDEEVISLTDVFINSGDILDLSDIPGVKVDKHSTGGIGDKTTLIVGPILASLGLKVCKMSGRGLGYTGGTIDKLESIPGFRVDLSEEEIKKQVNAIGISLTSQTKDLVPLDKKVYALRDVTGTTSSIPLIASSIMSKKIASGATFILIDIKVGSGALIKSREDAEELSRLMIKIGLKYNRIVRTIITDMSTPLGKSVGNSLEVIEAISILRGKGNDSYLYKVVVELASTLVSVSLGKKLEDAREMVIQSINSGKAYQKFLELVSRQGGRLNELPLSNKTIVVRSDTDGVIREIDALQIGKIVTSLGGGCLTKDDKIDYRVGIILHKKVGDFINYGDALCTLYLGDKENYIDPLTAFKIEHFIRN